MLSAKAKKGEAPFPYLTNQNIQWGRIDLGKLNEMDFNEKEKGKFSLRPGDLLVCEGGEVGRTAIWRGEVEDCYYQKALHRLRAKKNYLPEIMLQFMFWANSQGVFKGLTGHSTIAHLTAVKLKEMEVPDIPIEVQRKIKEKFDEIEVPKSKIEFQFKQSLGLRKSLINQVF
jgi:type I restriction enzyme S subunit